MQLSAQWVNTKGVNWKPGDELAFSMPVLLCPNCSLSGAGLDTERTSLLRTHARSNQSNWLIKARPRELNKLWQKASKEATCKATNNNSAAPNLNACQP